MASSVLIQFREWELSMREPIPDTTPASKRKRMEVKTSPNSPTSINQKGKLFLRSGCRTQRSSPCQRKYSHSPQKGELAWNAKSNAWKSKIGGQIELWKSQSDPDLSIHAQLKGSLDDYEMRYAVRRFLPAWSSRIKGRCTPAEQSHTFLSEHYVLQFWSQYFTYSRYSL